MEPVKVYVMKNCHYCHQALEFLSSNGISYKEVSIDDQEGRREWSAHRTQGVPTFVIGQIVIAGFDESRLRKALKLDGSETP